MPNYARKEKHPVREDRMLSVLLSYKQADQNEVDMAIMNG